MAPTTSKGKKRAATDSSEGSSRAKKSKSTPTNSKPTTGNIDAKQTAERKKKVKASAAKNPANVFVIGPPNNAWEDNSKKLAGYLHFIGPIENFRIFVTGEANTPESKAVADILDKYLSVRQGNYGKPDTSLSKGKLGLTIGTRQLFETIDDTSNDITQLFQTEVTLPLPTTINRQDDAVWKAGTMRYAIATTIKAMIQLIASSPTMFPSSHVTEDLRLHPMGVTRYSAEDWHRAYQLLRFCFRQHSDVKEKTNFFTHKQSDKGDAEAPLFYTIEELEEATDATYKELDLADGDEEGRVVGALVHHAQSSAPTAESATEPTSAATMPDLDDEPMYWAQRQKEFEASVEQADKDARAGKDVGSHGVIVKRNRLDKKNMRKLCIALGEECNIIHDDATIMAESGNIATKVDSASRALDPAQSIASRGMNITDPAAHGHELIEEMSEVEKAQYWQTQYSLSTVSAPTKSYEESCRLLGYDFESPTPFPENLDKRKAWQVLKNEIEEERRAAIEAGEEPVTRAPLGPEPVALVLNGWQVMGAQWSIEQEEGPIGGGIVCDDCGTGKTIQMLIVIYEHFRRMKANHIAGSADNPSYKPTIILAPATVVDVWFEEINRWFPRLKAWRYFEQANKVNHAFMKERTLPTKAEQLVQWLNEHCPKDNPDSCGVVIISAYETFQYRTLVVTKKGLSGSTENHTPVTRFEEMERLPDEEEDMEDTDQLAHDINYQHYEYSSVLTDKFYRLILDEAHKIRNPYTKTAEAIRRLEVEKKHLITATPMLNRGVDFFSYLTMFWQDSWDVDMEQECVGEFVFNYYDAAHLPQNTPAYQRGGALDYKAKQLALWRLNPNRFARTMNVSDPVTKCLYAYDVLRQVIPLLMLRRTQATIIEVNGIKQRIGDSIPPYRICTVELGWSHEMEFQAYKAIFDQVIHYLYTGASKDGGKPGFVVPTGSKKNKDKAANLGNTGTRAFAIHRALGVLTFNRGLYTMLQRTAGRNLVTDVEEWYQRCADKGMSLYFEMTKPEPNLPLYADRWTFARYLAKDSPKLKYVAKLMGEICLSTSDPRRVLVFTDWPMNQWNLEGFLSNIGFNVKSLRSGLDASERKVIIDDFNNPLSNLDALLLSIKASGAGLNLHWSCSDIIIACVADNINMVMQALGRAHRIGQARFQRVYIVTQDHSYDQLLQASQTKKMLQQIAGEGLIEIDVSDFEVTAEQIAEATADIDDFSDQAKAIDALKDQALMRKGRAIARQSEAIIAQMMGQRCSRLSWADNKNLKMKDEAEQQMATPAQVRTAVLSGVQPVPLSFGRSKEPSFRATTGPAPLAYLEHQEINRPAPPPYQEHQETAGPAPPSNQAHQETAGLALPAQQAQQAHQETDGPALSAKQARQEKLRLEKLAHQEKLRLEKQARLQVQQEVSQRHEEQRQKLNEEASARHSARQAQMAEERAAAAAAEKEQEEREAAEEQKKANEAKLQERQERRTRAMARRETKAMEKKATRGVKKKTKPQQQKKQEKKTGEKGMKQVSGGSLSVERIEDLDEDFAEGLENNEKQSGSELSEPDSDI